MAETESTWKNIATIVMAAIRALVLTLVLMVFLGFVLMIASYFIAQRKELLSGPAAALLSFLVTVALGWMMAVKRAIASGLEFAAEKYQVGASTVQLIFSKIPRIGAAHDVTKLMPMVEAEGLLRKAVYETLNAPNEGGGIQGFVRRNIQENLIEKIELLTLAKARASDGGVDLFKVRDVVAAEADAAILAQIDGVKTASFLFVALAIVASVAIALAMPRFLALPT